LTVVVGLVVEDVVALEVVDGFELAASLFRKLNAPRVALIVFCVVVFCSVVVNCIFFLDGEVDNFDVVGDERGDVNVRNGFDAADVFADVVVDGGRCLGDSGALDDGECFWVDVGDDVDKYDAGAMVEPMFLLFT
jgi:hypothetical protein